MEQEVIPRMSQPNESHIQKSTFEIIAEWILHKSAITGAAESTLLAYQRDVSEFMEFLTAHRNETLHLQSLLSIDIKDARSWMAHQHRKGISARSLARKVSAVKGFFRWLGETEGFDLTSFLSVRTPRFQRSKPRPVSPDAALDILEFTKKSDSRSWISARDTAIISLLYGCGLRISETMSLTWANYPLPDSLRILGKGKKERLVPTLPTTKEAVDKYAELCPFPRKIERPMFVGVRGGALNQRIIRHLMERARGALGLPASATPHALRHSFASHLLKTSGDLRAIQELLGHSSLSTTQAYTEVDQAQLEVMYRNSHPRND